MYAYLAPMIAIFGEQPATLIACRVAMLPLVAVIAAARILLSRRMFGAAAILGLF